jgi:hypothetical protein
MKDASFYRRLKHSAQDFESGLRKPIERQFGVDIYSIEELPRKELVNTLDFVGVDAFVMDKKQEEMYGIGSRVNYAWFEKEPSFSFRYAIWDAQRNEWKFEREYQRKLEIANRPEKQIFPELHVESFSREKGSGHISWAIMGRTKDILNYIETNIIKDGQRFVGSNGVHLKEPKTKERRLVVSVSADALNEVCKVKEIRIK